MHDPDLAPLLPAHRSSEIIGLLSAVARADPAVPEAGPRAAVLYVAYCRASGVDPVRAADLLLRLPQQLREPVRNHG